MELTKEEKQMWKQLMISPNEERSLQTSNHVSEFMFDYFTKQEAIEAICYWRNKFDELIEEQNNQRMDRNLL